jgi:hypothetical protein
MDMQVALILRKLCRQIDAVTAGSAFCMLKEENVDWIHLAQDRGQWRAVNMVINPWAALHVGTLMTSRATGSFSRKV